MPKPQKITRLEAARAGLTRYYTGRQCKRGHRNEHYTMSGTCVKCARKSSAKWKRKNAERVREMNRASTARHRAKLRGLLRRARRAAGRAARGAKY